MLSALSLIKPIFKKTFTGNSLPQQLAISRALCSHLWLKGLLSSLCLCKPGVLRHTGEGQDWWDEALTPCGWQGLRAGCIEAAPQCEVQWDLGSAASVPTKPGKG